MSEVKTDGYVNNEELEKKYEELKDKMEGLEFQLASVKQQFYFDMRNKQLEIEVLKNKLREARSE